MTDNPWTLLRSSSSPAVLTDSGFLNFARAIGLWVSSCLFYGHWSRASQNSSCHFQLNGVFERAHRSSAIREPRWREWLRRPNGKVTSTKLPSMLIVLHRWNFVKTMVMQTSALAGKVWSAETISGEWMITKLMQDCTVYLVYSARMFLPPIVEPCSLCKSPDLLPESSVTSSPWRMTT